MVDKKLWLDIVEIFRQNIYASVVCPNCKNGILQVKDLPFDKKDISIGGERYIGCPVCKEYKMILYRTPPYNWCEKID